MFGWLRTHPLRAQALRRAGRRTARQFAWAEIMQRLLVPRIELIYGKDSTLGAESRSFLQTVLGKKVRGRGSGATLSSGSEGTSWKPNR